MPPKDPNLPNRVLVVDNDQAILNTITKVCGKYQINAIAANTYENALYHFNQGMFDIAIVQLSLEDLPGPLLIQKWRHHEIETKRNCAFILLLGGPQAPEENSLAQEMGDTFWLHKPINEPKLISLLGKVMVARKQREQIQDLKAKVIAPLIKKQDTAGLKEIAASKLPQMGTRGKELAAEVLETIADLGGALRSYTGLHEEAPNNMRYVNEMGRLNLQLGNLVDARQAFEKADAIAPNNLQRLQDMATLYMRTGEPDKSVAKFKQVIDLDPSDPEKKYDFFEQLQNAGYESHAQELCSATTTPMELIRHYNNKGVMYSKSQEYINAIDEYKKAQKLIPGNKHLYRIIYNEALANINLKTPEALERAEALLNECLKLDRTFTKAAEKLAYVQKFVKKTG